MWIAIRPFRYRGKKYEPGEAVPAEKWAVRRGLEVRGKIRKTKDNPETISISQLKAMTRAELNVLAGKLVVEDPTSYPNRDSLIGEIQKAQGIEDEVDADDDQTSTSEEDDSEETDESDDSGDENTEDSDSEEDKSDEDD